MSWNGMFKKFNRKTVTDTDVVVQRGISAGGDVTGIREAAPEDVVDRERFVVVTESNLRLRAENARLVEENRTLRQTDRELEGKADRGWSRGYDEGRVEGLKIAWNLVTDAEGRPGKRQLAEMLQGKIREAEGQNHG